MKEENPALQAYRDLNEQTIVENVKKDKNYAPYCLRCTTMDRMKKVEELYWKCLHCPGVCDLRIYKE